MLNYKRSYPILLLPFLLLVIFFTISRADIKTKVTARAGDDGIQRIEILAGEYFFNPDHIVVKVNIPVEVQIRKKPGLVPHNIVADSPIAGIDFNQSMETEPKIITFTPLKTGMVVFFCDKKFLFFKSHRSKGMEGTIEVAK